MYLESNPYSTRSQMIMILLATMAGRKGAHSKRDVISMIESSGWFAFMEEDRRPYPTVKTGEPRWHTSIAFRRKDCYDEELFIRDGVRDSWAISKDGVNAFVLRKRQFADGQLNCAKCYMWSPKFKQYICPGYIPSTDDARRPYDVYKDYTPQQFIDYYANFFESFADEKRQDSEQGGEPNR